MKNILSISVCVNFHTNKQFICSIGLGDGSLQLLAKNVISISSPFAGWYVLPEQLGLPHGVHLAGAVGGGLQAAPGQAHLHAVQVGEGINSFSCCKTIHRFHNRFLQ